MSHAHFMSMLPHARALSLSASIFIRANPGSLAFSLFFLSLPFFAPFVRTLCATYPSFAAVLYMRGLRHIWHISLSRPVTRHVRCPFFDDSHFPSSLLTSPRVSISSIHVDRFGPSIALQLRASLHFGCLYYILSSPLSLSRSPLRNPIELIAFHIFLSAFASLSHSSSFLPCHI